MLILFLRLKKYYFLSPKYFRKNMAWESDFLIFAKKNWNLYFDTFDSSERNDFDQNGSFRPFFNLSTFLSHFREIIILNQVYLIFPYNYYSTKILTGLWGRNKKMFIIKIKTRNKNIFYQTFEIYKISISRKLIN